MKCIGDWIVFLDQHSGSLTFIATFVYVIATIFICAANISSANAARKQLNEMKKQYEEENRPIIEVELVVLKNVILALRFVNHGKKVAQKVKISVAEDFVASLTNSAIAHMVKDQQGKTCVIGVGQHYDLFICDTAYMRGSQKAPVSGSVQYSSGGIDYSSDYYIDLGNYMTYYSIDSNSKSTTSILQEQTRELERINTSLQGLKAVFVEERQDNV